MRVAIYMVTGLYPEHLELMPLNGNKITRLPVSIAGLALTTWLLPMELLLTTRPALRSSFHVLLVDLSYSRAFA